jgi:predicted transcriptional regulator
MTKLLERAIEAARRLSPTEQDAIAEAIMQLAGDRSSMVPLSPDERDAIDRSKAAAARGEFASEDEVRRVWAKHDR